jgi:hypothetical protein
MHGGEGGVVRSPDTLVLTRADENMNVGPRGETLTDDYVFHTLRPYSLRWDLKILLESTPNSFLDASD